MKLWLRFFFGASLALLAAAQVQAAAVINASGISASPSSAKPGEQVQISVTVTNSGTATPGDDFPIGGSATADVTFTQITTGYAFTVNTTVRTTAIVLGAGGGGTLTGNVTVPTQFTEAGTYRASVELTAPSNLASLGSATFAVSSTVLTVTGTPDLRISSITYAAGTSYRGGDRVTMTAKWRNQTSSNGQNNVPWLSSASGARYYRIQVVLSSNPTYGDADDFLLTFFDYSAKLDADSVDQTYTWDQLLPGNFSGSYYVLAKIDALDAVTETIENDLTQNGNNLWNDIAGTRIAIQPSTFPTIYLASTASGSSGNGYSDNPSLTADGRYTAFASDASNLVTSDTNGVRDVFIFDNLNSTVRRLNRSQQGAEANGASNNPALSGNGRYLAFSSDATNLNLGDVNGFTDIFIVDTLTGAISLQSVTSAGAQASGSSFRPSVSHTGRYIVFESSATNLTATATTFGQTHIYLRDRDVSGSGTFDTAGNIATTLIDVVGATTTPGNASASQAQISADGNYIAFASKATNLAAFATTAGRQHIYLRNRTGTTTTLMSLDTGGTEPNADSRNPTINRNTGVSVGTFADGRYVAFASDATDLIAADANAVSDVFVADRGGSAVVRVSVSSAGAEANDPTVTTTFGSKLGSVNPSISATGRYLTFASLADNLAPGDAIGQYKAGGSDNAALNIYVMDRDVSSSGTYDTAANISTTNVSVNRFGYQSYYVLNVQSTAAADIFPVISADGRWVAFPFDAAGLQGLIHSATNMLSPDQNGWRDVALFDRRTNSLPTSPTAPTVTITSPGNGGTALVNTAISVTATATTTTGVVSSVQFFVNGTSIGSSSTFPYAASWTPTAVGTYTLSALVTDSFGNLGVSPNVSVTINAAPSVGVTSPSAGASITVNTAQTITATAAASNPGATITSVQFYINGTALLAAPGDTTPNPYSAPWTPTANGTYSLTTVATDSIGTQTTSPAVSVTVVAAGGGGGGSTPPTVSISAPSAGSSLRVNTSTTVAATATAATGAITSVQFFANGTAIGSTSTFPYITTWRPTTPGTYALTAIAADNLSVSTTSAAVSVTVTAGTGPSVAIGSPATGSSVVVNTPQTLEATASSASGFITQVAFFINGVPLSTDTTYPYSAAWAAIGLGTYSITARATDNVGNITESTAVSITAAASSVPTVAVTNPATGTSFTVGATVNLTADAADADGTIALVEFLVNGVPLPTTDNSAPYAAAWTPPSQGIFTVTARATDNSGNITTSNPITVTIGANARPTVSLTSPSTGLSYGLGNQLLVAATANDADGTITSVQFFANGLQIGSSSSAPFNTSWRPTINGNYSLTAVATDNAGNTTTSSPVAITVTSSGSPTVAISNPIVGSSYVTGNSIPFVAIPSGGNGPIVQIQFFVNGAPIGTDNSQPYSAAWTPTASGNYSLMAVATDSAGISANSSALSITITGNSAPTVTITSPPTGVSLVGGSTLTITANAADSDGTVASVRFLANGNTIATATAAPFAVSWSPSAAGSYVVVAQATDNSGNVTNSAGILVNVSSNQAPTVSLTSPGNGSSTRVATGLSLSATASDADGTITGVQFFANGSLIGNDTSPPYSVQWTPGAEGIYRITATALDNSGTATTSSTVTVVAVSGTSGDRVYTGTFFGLNETGRFALLASGQSANFIGYSTAGGSKVYSYSGIPVDSAGGFSLTDSTGRVLLAGGVSDTGVTVSRIDGNSTVLIGSIASGNGSSVPAGLYSGNLAGKTASQISAIVGPDGSIMLYAADGTNRSAGSGSVSSTGGFTNIASTSGGVFAGRVDPATGFLAGTLSGSNGGTFSGGLASGVSFSDGFLRNLSSRGRVGVGVDALTAGFYVAGNTPKQVMIRAIGPSLAPYGVTSPLSDPWLTVYNSQGIIIYSNNDWLGAPDVVAASGAVGAFPLSSTSRDSVVLATLAPGAYTTQVTIASGGAGIGLVEIYDVDQQAAYSSQKVVNLSTRGLVGPDQDQLSAGFMVSGNTPKKVLIRAAGPGLGVVAPVLAGNVLADPILRLQRINPDGTLTTVRENDSWEVGNDGALVNAAAVKSGAFPFVSGSKDAALLITIPPGAYIALVSGPGTSTGLALVEVYEVP